MKKLLASLVALTMLLVGCGSKSGSSSGKPEVAMITDSGSVKDKSFNQSAWEAVKEYGEANGLGYKYYKPASFDDSGYLSQGKNAIKNGAKVLVLPGFKFAYAAYALATEYTDVSFILIDTTPADEEGNAVEIPANMYCALYSEHQAGFLAGYAAVKDGYTKLGFMGGMALPSVINFGYGFIQGADVAAQEDGTKVSVNYHYTGVFNESPDIQSKASSWYNSGTEVIFSCGGQICNSIFAAAEEAGKKSIGVDTDQSGESDTVITSAMKGVKNTVADQLAAVYNGNFKGGVYTLDASGNYVGLPEDFSRFTKFTADDYKAVFAKVSDGSIKILTNDDVKANGDPNGKVIKGTYKNVTVKYEK